MVDDRIEKGYQGKRKIRENAVRDCGFILSGSPEVMQNLDRKELLSWAAKNYEFFGNRYGKENIVRCSLHLDEETPHLHLHLVPLTKAGKLSAKEIFTPLEMKQLQTQYAKEMEEFGLKRGIEGSNRKHVTTREFYKYLEANEMDAKEILDNPKAVEIVGKMLQQLQAEQQIKNMESLKTSKSNYYERNESKLHEGTGERKEPGENNSKGFTPGL
jgi:diadenosine tetraphosphate (Ap4A) HIT family hydrolase